MGWHLVLDLKNRIPDCLTPEVTKVLVTQSFSLVVCKLGVSSVSVLPSLKRVSSFLPIIYTLNDICIPRDLDDHVTLF